jgi:hypothetical protein
MELDKFWMKAIVEAGAVFLVLPNQAPLVARSDAIRFVEWLIQEKRKILGLEGFTFDGDNLSPLMDCVADFSEPLTSVSSGDEAKKVLQQPTFKQAMFIDFVLE